MDRMEMNAERAAGREEGGVILLEAPAPPGLEGAFRAWGEATTLAIGVAEARIMQALHSEVAALREMIGARALATKSRPAPPPKPPRAEKAPKADAAKPLSWRTPERRAILLAHYSIGTPRGEIETMMRAFPGPDLKDVYMWASDLGLKRYPQPVPEGVAEAPPMGPSPPASGAMTTRDGQISVARLIEARADADAGAPHFVTLAEALAWAKQAHLKIPDPKDAKSAFAAVNALRRQWGLPTWRPAPWREGRPA